MLKIAQFGREYADDIFLVIVGVGFWGRGG